jgi:hypothetical protein
MLCLLLIFNGLYSVYDSVDAHCSACEIVNCFFTYLFLCILMLYPTPIRQATCCYHFRFLGAFSRFCFAFTIVQCIVLVHVIERTVRASKVVRLQNK